MRMENEHAGARQKRRVELEGRVLGRRADQSDRAVLHHGQETVLLRAVEAVDLVDEEQRATAHLAAPAGLLEGLLEVGDAREDRRDLFEMQVGLAGQQPRHRRLAGAGRAPEDHGAERAGIQHARERAGLADEMVLSDDLGETGRAQPVGERPRRRLLQPRRLEQIAHLILRWWIGSAGRRARWPAARDRSAGGRDRPASASHRPARH